MSAGIQEFDVGVVNGTTWHRIPSYTTQDTPVTIQQARDVMCYPLRKEQLHRNKTPEMYDADYEAVKAWCIVRKDHDAVLVDHVGERFVVLDNSFLLNFVNENLLSKFQDLEIESVGTLYNGATAFINLKIAEFQIKGDKSPTVNRLMYYNPLGMGSYKACCHDVRIVCNNTLRMAEADGAANKSLAKFRHTASAGQKINDHLEHLAEIKLELKKHIEVLDSLTTVQITEDTLNAFKDHMFPLPTVEAQGEAKTTRAMTLATNKRDELSNIFESDQALDPRIDKSAYALLQATTNYLDGGSIKNGDAAAVQWDGIIGQRAKSKDTALKFLANLS